MCKQEKVKAPVRRYLFSLRNRHKFMGIHKRAQMATPVEYQILEVFEKQWPGYLSCIPLLLTLINVRAEDYREKK